MKDGAFRLMREPPHLQVMGRHYYDFPIAEGWVSLCKETFKKLFDLYQEYDIPLSAISVDQIKEKFGSLRIYATCMNPYVPNDFLQKFYNILDEAEERSYHVCELCGEPGILRTDLGWIHTLCKEHYDDAIAKKYLPQ